MGIKYDKTLSRIRDEDMLLTIPSNNVFDTAALRNAAIREWGTNKELVYSVVTETESRLYKYIGTPKTTAAVSVDADWLEVTTIIRGPVGPVADLSGIEDNAILMKSPNANKIIAAPALVEDDRVDFSRSIQTTSSTVWVSQNLGLKGSGLAFAVFDNANNRTGFLVAYQFDDGGSGAPFFREFGSVQTNEIQGTQSEIDPSDDLDVTITATENRLVRAFRFFPSEDISDASFTLSYIDNGNEEEVITATMDLTANIENVLVIDQGLFIEQGSDYNIKAEGVKLRGLTISGSFVPAYSIDNHLFTVRNIMTESNITSTLEALTGDDRLDYNSLKNTPTAGAPTASVHNFSVNVARRIDIGTSLSSTATATYSITNFGEITSMELFNGNTKLQDLTVPTSDGQHTETVDLSSINTASQTTINLKIVANSNIDSNIYSISVRNIVPAETAYSGVTSSSDLSSVLLTSLTSHEVRSGTTFNVDFTIPNGEYASLLIPNDLSVRINDRSFNVDITNDFVQVNDVRTEGSTTLNTLTHQNNSGVQGSLQTTITIL